MIKSRIQMDNSASMDPALEENDIQNEEFREELPSHSKKDANGIGTELRKDMHRKCESVGALDER